MTLPLPSRMSDLLISDTAFTSRSLLFDKGMGDEKNKEFLARYIGIFRGSEKLREHYKAFIKRRKVAFADADKITLKTAQRLVVGLGLPHPTETGLLLDRLTSVPYLPGSSIKGLLRSAAGLAISGEFPADVVSEDQKKFWAANIDRIFGLQEGAGEMIFYDAFPNEWPELELDIMTPHYGDYYMKKGVIPGDWFNPTPIPFLTVKVGTPFRFWFKRVKRYGGTEQDEKWVKVLLPIALDWLGIGAKKSAGYGTFER
jgi:CRISPR-associated protein Cmr6